MLTFTKPEKLRLSGHTIVWYVKVQYVKYELCKKQECCYFSTVCIKKALKNVVTVAMIESVWKDDHG